jgi:hypothetical protein
VVIVPRSYSISSSNLDSTSRGLHGAQQRSNFIPSLLVANIGESRTNYFMAMLLFLVTVAVGLV